ncbi:hypothetical protein [Haloglomus litoreum]|uniref:hypothetical protein n=1 Tax=Haloglomus litoreum TaxID=3034026 RepID=UPI0023E7BE2A|nr:hypothetical protein [Haloglomus sp. DT116]
MDEQLSWVTSLFAEHDVTHWVESGTLLTLVRSGELTKYDDDIDLAVWASDVDVIEALRPEIESKGYHVQSRSYRGHTYKYQFLPRTDRGPRSRSNRRIVDVMVFRRDGECAWTAQSRVREEFGVPGLTTVVDRLYPFIQWYARSTGGHVEMTSFPKSLLVEVLTLRLPLSHLEELRYDEELGVHTPTELEDYLAIRYGDWETPVAEWSLTDDGAVHERGPSDLLA